MNTWLWPDRTIGKRESATLREEHNASVNSHAELLDAIMDMLAYVPPLYHDHVKDGELIITVPADDLDRVVEAIRKAKGE